MRTRRRLIYSLPCALVVALLLASSGARSNAFPEKPIRLIVPYSSGSITDVIARIAAAGLSDRLKHPVVVDARTGAGGLIALKALQASAPDGYTLGLVPSGSVVQPWLMKDMPFDVRKDFQALSLLFAGPLMLVVPPSMPARSLGEFVAYARDHPNKVFYGSSGIGTATHLAAELMKQAANVEMTHVPFRGSAEVYTAMLSGNVNAYFDLYGTAKPLIEAGKIRVLGVTSSKRMPGLPDVPAIAEVVPGYEVLGWTAFAVPNGTPRNVVDKLASALRDTLRAPDVRKRLSEMGVEAGGGSPAETAMFIAAEYDKWGQITRRAGMKPE
jgi:tripartite-type tricarboxylate transporter receptor subunit TctC